MVGPLAAWSFRCRREAPAAEFAALSVLAPGRGAAPLGTGDHNGADENLADGGAFAPPEARRGDGRRGRTLTSGACRCGWVVVRAPGPG